jgi:hypothetical protein
MYSYNHAQRAVAGGKYGCSKAAAPVFKKASIALDLITSASRALTVPSNGVPGIWCFKLRTHQDLSFVLVAWLLQQGMKATQEAQDLKVRRAEQQGTELAMQQLLQYWRCWKQQPHAHSSSLRELKLAVQASY